jgi:hypothetical protein
MVTPSTVMPLFPYRFARARKPIGGVRPCFANPIILPALAK